VSVVQVVVVALVAIVETGRVDIADAMLVKERKAEHLAPSRLSSVVDSVVDVVLLHHPDCLALTPGRFSLKRVEMHRIYPFVPKNPS